MRRLAPLLPIAALLAGAGPANEGSITLYCGGGVTGGGGGVAAREDGTLLRLRRPRAGAPMAEERVEATAPIARWQAMLDAAGFDTMPRGAPSNMTCSLARIRAGATRHVLWNGASSAPAPLRTLVEDMRAAVREPR